MILFFVIVTYILIFVIIEYVSRRYDVEGEVSRKIAHIISGLLALMFFNIVDKNTFLYANYFFLIIFVLNCIFKQIKFVQIKSRFSLGEIAYVIALIYIASVSYENKVMFTNIILLLIVPDVVAGMFSYYYHSRFKYIGHFLVYFAFALIVNAFFWNIDQAVNISLMLAIVESLSPFGFDNFTVPLLYFEITKLLHLMK